MMYIEIIAAIFYTISSNVSASSMILPYSTNARSTRPQLYSAETDAHQDKKFIPKKKTDSNQAMALLRRKGIVGGYKDFTNAIGIDEGAGGKNAPIGKFTSCGSEWLGISDRVVGGFPTGFIVQEVINDRTYNVLRGKLSPLNNGGFIQMAVDLAFDPSIARFVDVSSYDGIILDVFYNGEKQVENFNVQ